MGQPLGGGIALLTPADATAETPIMLGGGGNVRRDGTFRALPPDDRYLAVAVDYAEEGETGDPEFLDEIRASATRFALGEGETRAPELKLVER